jgi:hypothetical protein
MARSAGHQKHVGSSFNLVRKFIAVSDPHRDLLGYCAASVRNISSYCGSPVPIAVNTTSSAASSLRDLLNKIKPLLRRKPRHDPDHWALQVLRWQPERLKQVAFADLLRPNILRSVGSSY